MYFFNLGHQTRTGRMMQKLMLMGDEAVARGALDAGMSGIYAYPGTPSTEITEYVQGLDLRGEVHSEWSANEKTAMESALGMSYAGKRAMVCMKHVGLNVAADPFMNAAITGVNGGMVIAVADDPSMHSSQNEQDSRYFARFAMIPVLEPSSQQEAYDMAYGAFDLSERYLVPVMIRLTTRLAHSRSGVKRSPPKPRNELRMPGSPTQFILLPGMARKSYRRLIDVQADLEKESHESRFNAFFDAADTSVGILTGGLAYNYLAENFDDFKIPWPVLKICQYPLPVKRIRELYERCDSLIVIEEGYPLIEETLRGVLGTAKKIRGKLDGSLPRTGELNPDVLKPVLGLSPKKGMEVPSLVRDRPPALCKGCSHADVFHALNEAMESYGDGRVFSDIGCYTLGAFPPFNALDTCVDMGASITMAKGAADAGLIPSVSVIGDSTFTHSGMTGLLDAVRENSPITVIISDNRTTAMTGGQKSHAEDRLESICRGLGVSPEHIRRITPLKKYHRDNVEILKEEIAYGGLSVILAERECIQTATRRKRKEKTKP
jgi:indolepyruvate ferredoxin oxidoreductase alpha subunit